MGAEEGDALFKGRPIRAGRSTAAERVILTGDVQSIPDLFEDPEFDPKIKAAIRGAVDSSPAFASLRSLIAVPMKRDEAVVGVIVIARSQTGFLPARQLELLQTFADQAVIAIENARLFDEVQARTRDLSEALQQQTATADVLQVISRSAFGLKTVLHAAVGIRPVQQLGQRLPPVRESLRPVQLNGAEAKGLGNHVVVVSRAKNIGIRKMKRLAQNESGILPREAVFTRRQTDLSARGRTVEYFVKHPPPVRFPHHERIRDEIGGEVRDMVARENRIPDSGG
jgi:hypothetical protein